MKLLLTSGGVTNPSIETALIGLLGKPIAESSALCIPTAQWGHPKQAGRRKCAALSSADPAAPDRHGLEVGGRARAHRFVQHR